MLYLRADTITEVTIGPAVAVGDGFTPVTGLVGASADEFEIIKHGATTTTTIAGTLAAITGADGYYALDLSATDTNTEGRLVLLINDDSLILPLRHEFMVVAQPVFDSLFAEDGNGRLPVNVVQWSGGTVATPTQTGVPEVDLTHVSGVAEDVPSNTDLNVRTLATAAYFDPAADTVANVTTVATTTTNTDMRGTDGVDTATMRGTDGANTVVPPSVAQFNARTLVAASYFDPAVDTVANVTTVAGVTGLTVSTITAGVWDELTATARTAGSYGQLFKDNVDAAISTRSSHGDPDPSGFIDAPISTVDTVVDAIKVQTDKFTFTIANRVDANTRLINGAVVIGDGNATPWDGA